MPPLMKCGHAANSEHILHDGTRRPSCVICYGIHSGADQIDETPPSLEGRIAHCSYRSCNTNRYGKGRTTPDYGEYFDASGRACAKSSIDLPFFEHKPNEPHDVYYCGCFGWD
jgi:hypothetical protein